MAAKGRWVRSADAGGISLLRIVVTLNYDDHAPPHFHARYGDHRASIGLDGIVIAGSLPPRALLLVRSWAAAHAAELEDDWDRARAQLPLVPIAPLD